jgi:ribosomal protein S18 acetylase RimI-like enzyme
MKIRTLDTIPLKQIIECFILAFSDYAVKMPENTNYYRQRFQGARVHYDLSYGMFDGDDLVGFIIHGIDQRGNDKVAFNTGTGVIPGYRGNRIVSQLYEFAIPQLIRQNVHICSLEVLTTNHKAIRIYERTGMSITKTLKCFKGDIHPKTDLEVHVISIELDDIPWSKASSLAWYSWDNTKEAMYALKANLEVYAVSYGSMTAGYFIWAPIFGSILQLDAFVDDDTSWAAIFSGIKKVAPHIKINNVHSRLIARIKMIEEAGLVNHIDQFEMEMRIQ